MKDVFKILNRIDGGIVLDAATGRGEFISILKENLKSYSQIIGIDSSEKTVDYAQKLFPENDVEIYRMNLESIQYEDSHFDTVCVSNSLHHFEHSGEILAELYRVLKPEGTFILSEMYKDGEQSSAQQTHILMHHWIAKVDRLSGVFHQETYAKSELESIAKKLKLKNTQKIDFYIPVDDPKAPRSCANLIKNCQDTIKRLETLGGHEDLVEEGNRLMQRINEIGCASASRMLIIGTKPKGDK